MKKFKIIFFVKILLIIIVLISGCAKQSNNDKISQNEINEVQENHEESNNDSEQENAVVKKENKLCSWIDESDVIIQLDLPEEYAHYNDKTVFPSYETGFMFKSAYGDIASSRRLARKDCNYRVGFSKEELNELHGRFFPIIYKGADSFLTYENEPMMISLQDGLPEQGNLIILKVTGEVSSFGHYNNIFN